jgi:hypothetical protein
MKPTKSIMKAITIKLPKVFDPRTSAKPMTATTIRATSHDWLRIAVWIWGANSEKRKANCNTKATAARAAAKRLASHLKHPAMKPT